jgi:hypothetical protein
VDAYEVTWIGSTEDRMTESNVPPGHRRTVWVTIAGGLFVTFGIWNTVDTVRVLSFTDEFVSDAAKSGLDVFIIRFGYSVSLAIGLFFAYGGLATLCRWRGWRVWYGALAWGMIVAVGLGLVPLLQPSRSGEPTLEGVLPFYLMRGFVIVGIAVLALLAKRAEKPRA